MRTGRGMAIRAALALLFAAGLGGVAAESRGAGVAGESDGMSALRPANWPGERRAVRDALLPVIPASGAVPASEEVCLAFGGIYDPAGGGFCVGIANPNLAAFCRIGPVCEALFGRVRDCNLEHNRLGGGYSAAPGGCGAGCGGGLSAVGNRCVYEQGGVIQTSEGELPAGIPREGVITPTEEACLAFGGIYDPAGTGFCVGIANPNLAAFCRIGPACQALFGRVRDCNLLNRLGGGYSAAPGGCGAACEFGAVARGSKCVAPPPSNPSTIMFSAGENGRLLVDVGGAAIVSGGEVSHKAAVRFFAVPDPGHHVSAWTNIGGGAVACADAPTGHGGPKTCLLTAGSGLRYNVSAAFAFGALPADIPASGDVPATGVGGVIVCLAFGGVYTPLPTTDSCEGFGPSSSCVIAESIGHDVRKCQEDYNAVRDCNLENKAYDSDVDGCAAEACGAGTVAAGGQCVAAGGSHRVFYTREDQGDRLDARRASDGGAVESGSYVAAGVFLSVTATPRSGRYVASWGGVTCVNQIFNSGGGQHGLDGFEGNFEEAGPKLCVFQVTTDVELSVNIADIPEEVEYPMFDTAADPGAGANAAEHQANCELFGGTYETTAISNGRKVCARLAAEYDPVAFNFASCEHMAVAGAPPTCGAQFNAMRACLIANRPALAIVDDGAGGIVANCGAICPEGSIAKGRMCEGPPAAPDESVYPFFDTAADPGAGTDAAGHQANCELFGGTYETTPLSGDRKVCAGLHAAYAPVMSVFASCEHVTVAGAPPTCGAQFNAMRACLIANKPALAIVASASGFVATCGAVCPAGWTAKGRMCEGPPVAPDESVYPFFDTAADPGAGADAAGHQANCELFGGTYETTALSGDRKVCAGLHAAYDAAMSVFASCEHAAVGDAPPTCGAQFNAMRACLIANKPVANIVSAGSVSGFVADCGAVCPAGLIAKGRMCEEPPAAPDESVYPFFDTAADPGAGANAAGHQANCELFGGTYETTPLSGDRKVCAGLHAAYAPVMSVFASCEHMAVAGAPPTCGAQFNAMRACLIANKPALAIVASGSGFVATCGAVCPAGSIAKGRMCEGPPVAPDESVYPFFDTAADPGAGADAAGHQANCELFGGTYETTALSGDRKVCAGLYAAYDAAMSVFASCEHAAVGDAPPTCGAQFNAMRACLIANKPVANIVSAGSVSGLVADCGAVCPEGSIAKGRMCEESVYPLFDTAADPGAGANAAEHQANCELFGGTYETTTISGDRKVCARLHAAYDPAAPDFASCEHVTVVDAPPTCGAQFNAMRECLINNKPVANIVSAGSNSEIVAHCGAVCPTGQTAKGAACEPALVSGISAQFPAGAG